MIEKLRSKKRDKEITNLRAAAINLLFVNNYAKRHIARFLQISDTSVIYHIEKHELNLNYNDYKNTYVYLQTNIKELINSINAI